MSKKDKPRYRRLTQEILQAILEAVGARAQVQFLKDNPLFRYSTDDKWWQRTSKRVYKEVFTAAERSRMSRLPKGWLPTVSVMRVAAKSQRHEGKEFLELSFGKFLPVPFDLHDPWDHRAGRKASVEGPATEELVAIVKLREDCREFCRKAREQARAIVVGAGNTQSLVELWPEVLTIMPEGFFEAPPPPVVVPGTQLVAAAAALNTLVGLPPQ